MASLTSSIEELSNADFFCSGDFKTDVIFDPTEGVVYASLNTGGQPTELYLGRHFRITTVTKTVMGSSLCTALLGVENLLERLAKEFLGTDDRGRGCWTEEGRNIQSAIEEAIEQIELGHYWEPEDWFQNNISDLKSKWAQGLTSEQIIDGENLGNAVDGECDRTAAIDWLDGMIEMWEEES